MRAAPRAAEGPGPVPAQKHPTRYSWLMVDTELDESKTEIEVSAEKNGVTARTSVDPRRGP